MNPNEIHLRIVQIVRMNQLQDSDYNMVTFHENNEYGIPAGTYILSHDGTWKLETYCCAMRKHYVLGIVGSRKDEPVPIEAADFVEQWSPKVVLRIRYCPFCGVELHGDQTTRQVG